MICVCCNRECVRITKHHLIPRTRHKNKKAKKDVGERLNETVRICFTCHKQIHATFSEKELERQYNTLDAVKAHPAIEKFIQWIRNKPEHLLVAVRKSR